MIPFLVSVITDDVTSVFVTSHSPFSLENTNKNCHNISFDVIVVPTMILLGPCQGFVVYFKGSGQKGRLLSGSWGALKTWVFGFLGNLLYHNFYFSEIKTLVFMISNTALLLLICWTSCTECESNWILKALPNNITLRIIVAGLYL